MKARIPSCWASVRAIIGCFDSRMRTNSSCIRSFEIWLRLWLFAWIAAAVSASRAKSSSAIRRIARINRRPSSSKRMCGSPTALKTRALNVLLSFIGVYNMSFRLIQGHGVDREVPSGEVFLQRVPESDLIRPALVRIAAFGTIWRHFYDLRGSVRSIQS